MATDLFKSAPKAPAARSCPSCGDPVSGHPNKKFCGAKCKDRHHNLLNPRGKFAHLKGAADPDMLEMIRRWEDRQGVEIVKSEEELNDEFYYATTHPFDSEALGQD